MYVTVYTGTHDAVAVILLAPSAIVLPIGYRAPLIVQPAKSYLCPATTVDVSVLARLIVLK